MTDASGDLGAWLAGANDGPLLAAKLVPLNNIGPLRVTYNWLYSALNCNPADPSPFGWVISKLGSGSQVSLSPQQGYNGMTLFASVRPDYNYRIQTQAPFSADWITAVGADEVLTMTSLGFLTIALQGLNGSYLAADDQQTEHDGYSGYLFNSNAAASGPASSFFVAVSEVLQPGLAIPRIGDLDVGRVEALLAGQGAPDPAGLTRRIFT